MLPFKGSSLFHLRQHPPAVVPVTNQQVELLLELRIIRATPAVHTTNVFPCDKFVRFNDTRGNDSRNPLYHCQVSSKIQVSGPDKRVARGLHYVYRLGGCDYSEARRDTQRRQITLDADLVGILVRMQII